MCGQAPRAPARGTPQGGELALACAHCVCVCVYVCVCLREKEKGWERRLSTVHLSGDYIMLTYYFNWDVTLCFPLMIFYIIHLLVTTFKRGRALLYIFVYDVINITVAQFMCIDLVHVQVGVHGGM